MGFFPRTKELDTILATQLRPLPLLIRVDPKLITHLGQDLQIHSLRALVVLEGINGILLLSLRHRS